ncbi:MAG: YfiR family protein [Pseudodesulfovibrio sp.]|nr:YfiR family protein [Pseudodesulfovibrio sp.]
MGFLSRISRILFGALLFGVFALTPARALSGSSTYSATVDQLRALFVQRMVKYVSWPEGIAPQNGEPFIIAATDVRKFRSYFSDDQDSPEFKLVQWPTEKCHVLVLTGTPERTIAAILKRISGKPILTIGQNPVNLRMGIVVNFIMVNGKLKFQINPKAADRAGLEISSRLLNLARIYTGDDNE